MENSVTSESKFQNSVQIITPSTESEEIQKSEKIKGVIFGDILDVNIDDIYLVNKDNTEQQTSFPDVLNEISPLYLPRNYEKLPFEFSPKNAPASYTSNNEMEEKCVEYASNFMRQFKILYKDRKYLFLTPTNELKVKKFISTFIKPTKLKFGDLYNFDSIASFVSDYLNFVPVLPTTEFPSRILSCTKLLEILKGTCFDYSNLLCSLLQGVGYNAYVVIGYATRECSLMDESRNICPFLEKSPELSVKHKTVPPLKYIVKPAKDLKSKFELYHEARIIQETEIENKRIEKEKELEQIEKEKPLPDPLQGLRVHSWILVKEPLRNITEAFFIEPLTGKKINLQNDTFKGIESIYNHQNCWINMQDCSLGINDLSYDFDDLTKWEFVLPTTLKYQNAKVIRLSSTMYSSGDDRGEDIKANKQLLNIIECPTSWITKLDITLADYKRRFPNNTKTTIYYKVKCERFSPYLNPNGLVLKLTLFTDRSLHEVIEIQEYYSHRMDKLYKSIKKNNWTTEYFNIGRSFQLIEHQFESNNSNPESNRVLLFNQLRVDGLFKREETQTSLTEYFANRSDKLTYLSCDFEERNIKFLDEKSPYRDIQRMTKRYERNYNIPYSNDIKEIVYYVSEEKISVTYHLDKFGLIPNSREFIKPQLSQDGKNTIPFYIDTHQVFEANPMFSVKKTKLETYQLLLELMEDERKTKDLVRWSENETKNILHERRKERIHNVLDLSLFDTLRNEVPRAKRIELELLDEIEANKHTEDELDFLAPFLAQLSLNDINNKDDAYMIREECLQDFKLRLIQKANIIHNRIESETSKLQKNQQWFQQNHVGLTHDDERNYINACNTSTFNINTLETMLGKHKQIAPHRYMELELRIRSDPRMKPYFCKL